MMINSYSKETSQSRIGGLGTLTNTLKGSGGSKGGNPYHDALGRFTTGPSTAFGEYNPTDNQVYDELLNHSSRLGLKINPDDIMDNGFSISTKLGTEQVDALARTTLVNDKIKRGKIHQEFIDKESDESQRKLVTDTMNRAGQHITFARNEIDNLVKSIGLDGSKNYGNGMELYAKGARNKIIDSANDSLNKATKYLDSRRSKFGIEGEKYAQKVWTQVETLQAAVNTLKSISNAMGNQPITDTFVQNPKKKATTTMPRTATLDDLAGMGLIPKPERMNQLQKNGGKGSGNFGHAGRPGEVGGSGKGQGKPNREQRVRTAIEKAITTQKELQDKAKNVREDIESRIGQKMKEGEEYTALDEAHKSRFKYFHGEDGTEYTYDKENGMITKTNPKTGDEEVVTKKKGGLGEKGDSYWGDAKQGIELLDGSKEDIVEQTRRQYGEDHAKQIKTEIERTEEHLSMIPDDWAVRIDRVSPGMLETKLASKYKIGDEFSIDGETMKVVEGDKPGTIMGVSEDKKRFASVPDEKLFEIAHLESQTVLDKKNYDMIRKIADGGKFNEKDAAERIIANIEEWSKKKGTA